MAGNSLTESLLSAFAKSEAKVQDALERGDFSQSAGVVDLLNLPKEEQQNIGRGGYEYMLAIRLPKTAAKKKKEQEAFARFKEKHKDRTVQDMLNKVMVAKNEKIANIKQDGVTSWGIDCDETLEGTLNCVIGMFFSFFQTLSESHNAPIELLKFNSVEVNKVFICTRMSPKLAETLADMAEYAVQLSEEGVEKIGIAIKDKTNLVPAFVKYDGNQKANGYLKIQPRPDKPNEQTILNHIDRIRLFYDKLTDHINVSNLQLMLQKSCNITMKMFPIHDEVELQKLHKCWGGFKMCLRLSQPLDDIRNYYGEEIAFYFLFTETMRKGLLVLLLLTMMFIPLPGRWRTWSPLYSVVIVAWFASLVKYWKRLEAFQANKWGSDYTHTNAAVKDLMNPDFDGEELPSEVDDNKMEKRADPAKQLIGYIKSTVVGTFFGLLVTCGVVLNRLAISHGWISRAHGNILVSVQIRIFSITWDMIVPKLTAGEHHVTMRAMGQSNALKTFIFLFFNTFNAFLWIAYVSPYYDPEACFEVQGGCRAILQASLSQAFPILVIFAGLGLAIPFLNIWQKYRKQANDLKELEAKGEGLPAFVISSMEMQTKMLEFGDADVADDYMQVISSIAFVGMWVVAAPMVTCVMAYVAVSVQHGVDAYRMTMLYQRPFPNRVANIGIWNGIMKFLKYATIVNLSGLLVTSRNVDMPGMMGILPTDCHDFAYRLNAYANSVNTTVAQAVADGNLPPQCTMRTAANLLVFFIVLVLLFCGVALFDTCVSDVGPITTLNKKRQLRQRAVLFDMDLQEFNEKVELYGHSKWNESKYHESSPQLKPGDPLYVECVTVGA